MTDNNIPIAITTNERGQFLGAEQKKVKQKIMEDLLAALFKNLEANIVLFDNPQSILDLINSILVMFNREVLVHIITTMHLQPYRKDIMKSMFEAIRDEVNRIVKERMI